MCQDNFLWRRPLTVDSLRFGRNPVHMVQGIDHQRPEYWQQDHCGADRRPLNCAFHSFPLHAVRVFGQPCIMLMVDEFGRLDLRTPQAKARPELPLTNVFRMAQSHRVDGIFACAFLAICRGFTSWPPYIQGLRTPQSGP
jgi:hypothetical protein